jgi:hypothetical protein
VTEPTTPEQTPAEREQQLRRAEATLVEANLHPLELAKMNAELRSSVKGSHAVVHRLVERLGGHVVIAQSEIAHIDPKQELLIKTLRNGDVDLTVKDKINLAIRPKKR